MTTRETWDRSKRAKGEDVTFNDSDVTGTESCIVRDANSKQVWCTRVTLRGGVSHLLHGTYAAQVELTPSAPLVLPNDEPTPVSERSSQKRRDRGGD